MPRISTLNENLGHTQVSTMGWWAFHLILQLLAPDKDTFNFSFFRATSARTQQELAPFAPYLPALLRASRCKLCTPVLESLYECECTPSLIELLTQTYLWFNFSGVNYPLLGCEPTNDAPEWLSRQYVILVLT